MLGIDAELTRYLSEYFAGSVKDTGLGWVIGENENFYLGPKYLCSYNSAKAENEIDYISQFAGEAPTELIEGFYLETNGLRFFGDRFVIPGVPLPNDRMDGLSFFNNPLDVRVISGIEYPRHVPLKGFVIAASQIWTSGATRSLFDVMGRHGRIISGFFNESCEILETWELDMKWILHRTLQAAHEFEKAKQKTLQ